jgi:twitching motility two-component system response regulator PilH
VNQNAASDERRTDDRVRASLGARVLVVDDSATIRVVLAKMLMQDGYEVFKAGDGESAVEMAQTQIPDLIFLDIVLPGMSGFAVLRALRRDSRTRDIPIIMMSGNQQATEQFYVQRFGADGFIKKPFGRAEVFHAVRSLVQAGRMPGRADTAPPSEIPAGITAEEWDAIPDVAMPDEAHLGAPPSPPVLLAEDPLEAVVDPFAGDREPTRHAAAGVPLQAAAAVPSPAAVQPAVPPLPSASAAAVPAVHRAEHPAAQAVVPPRAFGLPAFSVAMPPTLTHVVQRHGAPPMPPVQANHGDGAVRDSDAAADLAGSPRHEPD